MAEVVLTARSPLGGVDIAMRGTRPRERADLAIVSVATRDEAALAAALGRGWGIDLPGSRRSTVAGDVRAVRTAPDQIFLIFQSTGPDLEAEVRQHLDGAGYTTDQTGGWVVLDLSGPGCVAALKRICMIDLHPDAFPDEAAARTVMEHMGAVILRISAERFLLLSASSSAGSFLHAVETSCRNVEDQG